MQQATTNSPLINLARWLVLFVFLSGAAASAQQAESDPKEMVFTVVEHHPEFTGGSQALREYLNKELHYPDSAAKRGITGRVFVSFIVERNGQLTNVTVIKGIGFGCDEEAVRVVEAMPRWQPGTQSGRAVRVKYNLPILFGPK